MNPSVRKAVSDAVSAAGGQTAVAQAFELTPQAIQQWVESGRVPAERVLKLEHLSGVHRFALRPDIYPPEAA